MVVTTTFFDWRTLSFKFHSQKSIHLQTSIAVNSLQTVYALTWTTTGGGGEASDDLLFRHPPLGSAGRGGRGGLSTSGEGGGGGGGGRLEIHEIPFKAFTVQTELRSDHLNLSSSKGEAPETDKTDPNNDALRKADRNGYKRFQYSCDNSNDPAAAHKVPNFDRQIKIQAATVDTDKGKEVIIVALNSYKAYLFNTMTKEWLTPIDITSEHMTPKQLILMRGHYLFVYYHNREAPQFAIIDVAARSARVPVDIPALPRSHGLTFFVNETNDTLNAIVDRWPRCSREWWSLDMSSLLAPNDQQQTAVFECTQINSDSIELYHSEFIPVGNRWVIGTKGTRWKYHDYEENLIPHQINYVDGQDAPGTIPTVTVIDKCTQRVQKVKAMPCYASHDDADRIPMVTHSPAFYIPIKKGDLVTLELPAILSHCRGKLVLGIWGASLARLPHDIDQIWKLLSSQRIDDAVVTRILSFMLT